MSKTPRLKFIEFMVQDDMAEVLCSLLARFVPWDSIMFVEDTDKWELVKVGCWLTDKELEIVTESFPSREIMDWDEEFEELLKEEGAE